MIKRKLPLLLGLFLVSVISLSALTGRDIIQKTADVNDAASTHSLVDLQLVDKTGKISSRVIEMFATKNTKDEALSLIIFHSPASVKNTRFLSIENKGRDNDQWIYLPALKKVRRIAAGEGNKSFMGTDLTYDDMGARNIDDDTHTLKGEKTINGRNCYVIESIPRKNEGNQYSRRISYVDKERMIPLKMELFDKEGKLAKVMLMESIKKVQGHWTPFKTTMENVQTRHKTIINMSKLVYDEKLPGGIFTTRFLKAGRL